MLKEMHFRNAKAKNKTYKKTDANGLYLEIKPNGKKIWRYRFEIDGTESVFTIGNYSQIGLADARTERNKARELVKKGINPASQRKLDRIKQTQENATTFEAVAREWLALKNWEEITKTKRLSMLQRVVFPAIGKLPVKQVTPRHILDILTKTAPTKPSVAAEAKRTMSAIFELAVSTLRSDVDPVYPVRKALPANKTQYKRALSIEEMGQLLHDIDGYQGNFQTVIAFKLMWLTLCRPNEIIEARWEEIDLDKAIWRIDAKRMKKRKEHVVPLPHQAVELLRNIQGITGKFTHVFPNRDDHHKPMATHTMRQALKNLGWAGKYSPHATRTAGSTHLNEMGFSADWIERQLAHSEPNSVRRTYNHADYLVDRAKMMQQWADMIDKWQSKSIIPSTPKKKARNNSYNHACEHRGRLGNSRLLLNYFDKTGNGTLILRAKKEFEIAETHLTDALDCLASQESKDKHLQTFKDTRARITDGLNILTEKHSENSPTKADATIRHHETITKFLCFSQIMSKEKTYQYLYRTTNRPSIKATKKAIMDYAKPFLAIKAKQQIALHLRRLGINSVKELAELSIDELIEMSNKHTDGGAEVIFNNVKYDLTNSESILSRHEIERLICAAKDTL